MKNLELKSTDFCVRNKFLFISNPRFNIMVSLLTYILPKTRYRIKKVNYVVVRVFSFLLFSVFSDGKLRRYFW